ncbi:phytase [Halomonas sp. M5N1S17]|uniref:phytase n=1 Tax=Halomonas alkalisoli TaxID=2907158 RepID=UPI001F434961|nr:phytase [Halomonas alkalisoli]MCE9662759.1 phytase [Halomonas alkalisoli]
MKTRPFLDAWCSVRGPLVLLVMAVAVIAGAVGAVVAVSLGGTASAAPPLAIVTAQGETTPVKSRGDAADDAAIWFNVAMPEQSRILGTDKRRGLEVYDLQGQRVQSLPIGRLNNVDLRQGVMVNGQARDLAVATNRDEESLALFEITPEGEVILLGAVPTGLEEIYGACLYRHGDELHAFVNAKDGRYMQYRLALGGEEPTIVPLRYFRLDSQPEGCVADDSRSRLFVGEEDVGVWVMDASPDAASTRELIIEARDPLKADIEGLALYDNRYLVISSQGNHRFALLEATPPYRLQGIFRIDEDESDGIGHVRETDGLAVSAHDFGPGFEEGLVVVQDGRNSPENQNFKYLGWSHIAAALELTEQE